MYVYMYMYICVCVENTPIYVATDGYVTITSSIFDFTYQLFTSHKRKPDSNFPILNDP